MLQKRTEQFQAKLDSFHSLPRQWVLAIAAVLIAGGIYLVFSATSQPRSEPLFGGGPMRDFDLDQVELVFGAAGLTGWRREDQQIYVPSQSRHQYLAALQSSSALPFSLHSAVESALESGGYFESDAARRLRTQFAKAQDLGNKLTAFSDVQWASVDYDEQEAGGFGQDLIRSASVMIVSTNGKPLPAARIRMIQKLVAAAYAGMSSDDVVVTDTMARESVAGSDPAAMERFHQERELEEKISKLLTAYGETHVGVKLNENQQRVSVGIAEEQLRAQWRSQSAARDRSSNPKPSQPTTTQWNEFVQATEACVRGAVLPLLDTDESLETSVSLWCFPSTDAGHSDKAQLAQLTAIRTDWLEEGIKNPTAVAAIGSVFALAIGVSWVSLRLRVHRRAQPANETPPSEPATRDEEGTLREDLAELVEANPELAAQIVHGWMADAA